MDKYNNNAEYVLERLEIVTENKTYDLSSAMIELNLYESILNPFMSGDLMILDSDSFVSATSLGNHERIRLRFKTSGSTNIIDYTGVIYKVAPPGRVNEHTTGYVLNFVSATMIKNNKTVIKQGFNDTTANIVSRIHDLYLSSTKTLVKKESRNMHHYIANKKKPIEVISDLARKSVSTTQENGYLYYENNQEQRYYPIEALYKQSPTMVYKHKNAGIHENTKQREAEAFNAIQEYDILERPSAMSDTVHGLIGGTWTGFSLFEKKTVKTVYNPNKDYDPLKSLGKKLEDSRLDNSDDSYIHIDYANVYGQPDISRIKTNIALLRSQSYQVRIVVNGNSAHKAGDVLDVTVPLWSRHDDTRSEIDKLSGKFLITEIRHVLKNDIYTQHIKIIKDATE